MPKEKSNMYPLGGNLYASVKTYRRKGRIHIGHYAATTKEGRIRSTNRAVSLHGDEFARLIKVSRRLLTDYQKNQADLEEKNTICLQRSEKWVGGPFKVEPTPIQQRQLPTYAPPTPCPFYKVKNSRDFHHHDKWTTPVDSENADRLQTANTSDTFQASKTDIFDGDVDKKLKTLRYRRPVARNLTLSLKACRKEMETLNMTNSGEGDNNDHNK